MGTVAPYDGHKTVNQAEDNKFKYLGSHVAGGRELTAEIDWRLSEVRAAFAKFGAGFNKDF